MPVSPTQIRQLLQANRDALADFNQHAANLLERYRKVWRSFAALTTSERMARVQEVIAPTGARLLEETKPNRQGICAAKLQWTNREDSLDWAKGVLRNVITFAVDGSQVFPSKDLSLPIALVQVGWFENHHSDTGSYIKDIRLEIMTPRDLGTASQDHPVDRRVNIRRFEMEVERLVEFMEQCHHPDSCLVFFDGALVVTFAEALDPESREAYVKAMLTLLTASERYQVPLVGYIDTSYARDLTTLLQQLYSLPSSEAIHDAQILNPFMQWGDRVPFYQCDRGGILDVYGQQSDRIAFTYLKTTRESYPVRLEVPTWVIKEGYGDILVNRVRAEVVAGGGYPYALETADQTAVLQGQDRQIFYRILQDWANQESINLRFSRKMISKVRRR